MTTLVFIACVLIPFAWIALCGLAYTIPQTRIARRIVAGHKARKDIRSCTDHDCVHVHLVDAPDFQEWERELERQ